MSPLAAHAHDLSNLTPVEIALVAGAALVVVAVIWRAVVLTVRPGEEDPNHIKRMILDDDPPAGGDDRRSLPRP